jgi:hypothetical protein
VDCPCVHRAYDAGDAHFLEEEDLIVVIPLPDAVTTEYRRPIDQGGDIAENTARRPQRGRWWAHESATGGSTTGEARPLQELGGARAFLQVWLAGTTGEARPLQELDRWQRQAIKRIVALGSLPSGWDGYGGMPPSEPVRKWAIGLVADIQLGNLGEPEFAPIARGGLEIDWWSGHKREIELHIEPNLEISYLKVEAGVPLSEGAVQPVGDSSIEQLMTWLRRG